MKAKHDTTLVAIVGGSGSGKSWLAQRLVQDLGDRALSFSLDSFYRDRSGIPPDERESLNFDLPTAIEWSLFKSTLRDCANNAAFSLPQYDFQNHCRSRSPIPCAPASIAIIDGLWLLHHSDIRRMFDLTFYLECPEKLRMHRRIYRDVAERGRTLNASKQSFYETVNAMHEIYVVPQKIQAQRIVNCPFGEPEVAALCQSILAAGESCTSVPSPNFSNYDYSINSTFKQSSACP